MHIVHPTRSKSLLYYPDARFVTRSGKFWLFEVLDSETGSQAQMIAHIVEPLLVDGVLGVVHIVKTRREQEVLEDLTNIILARMTDLVGRKVDSRIRYFRVIISPSDSLRAGRIQKIFTDGGIRF